MRKLVALLLCACLALTGCATSAQGEPKIVEPVSYEYPSEYSDPTDPELARGIKEAVYSDLVNTLDSDQFLVDEVEVAYVSQEYLDELSYNSQENVFFGYSLSDVVSYFGDTPYVFTNEDGRTVAKEFESYDDTWEQIAGNIAVGSGVILVCVTVTAVAPALGAPQAITAIFTFATSGAISGAAIGAPVSAAFSGIMTGIETGSVEDALKAAAYSASEGYKSGAIMGAATGGIAEGAGLIRASRNGLTMSEAATIQMESKYPLSIVKDMRNMDEYEVYKSAGLKPCTVKTPEGTRTILARDLDMQIVDENGMTNLQRLQNGKNAVDANGNPFEWHHVGQKNDGALAMLSRTEHDAKGLHFAQESEIERQTFNTEKVYINKWVAELYAY